MFSWGKVSLLLIAEDTFYFIFDLQKKVDVLKFIYSKVEEAIMYCRKCGNEINESYSHCGYCGDDRSVPFDPDAKKVKVASALAYVGILFFLPLVICPDSKKGRFHANQGLVLFIMSMAISIVSAILLVVFAFLTFSNMSISTGSSGSSFIVSIIGYLVVDICILGVSIFFLVLEILGIINGARGIEQKLPLIGRFKILK